MSDKPRIGIVRLSDILADPTHRLDAEHWLNTAAADVEDDDEMFQDFHDNE